MHRFLQLTYLKRKAGGQVHNGSHDTAAKYYGNGTGFLFPEEIQASDEKKTFNHMEILKPYALKPGLEKSQ